MQQNQQIDPKRVEALGPAERIIKTLLDMTDHMVHNRPGLVTKVAGQIGVQWAPCTWVAEGEGPAAQKVVYTLTQTKAAGAKAKPKVVKTRAGVLREADSMVLDGARVVGEYRKPSDRNKLFPEIAAHLYRQVADIFKMDNEFVARWASYAFVQENRDLKTILAAFLLVQNRAGAPVMDDGKVLFHDDDFRDVGEAMFLIKGKGNASMEPKLLERVGDLLALPEIAAINRELGFGNSGKNAALGRYEKAVTKWLAYRELNPKMLEGLIQGGMRNTVIDLARRVHYKPTTPGFYEILRWKQKQCPTGHRVLAIGTEVKAAESWKGMTETAICEKIVVEKPGFKRLVGLLPREVGLTAAVMAAAMTAGSLSNKDLLQLSETLETLGLTEIEPFASRWKAALKEAKDQRALHMARNVKTEKVREALVDAADVATAKAFEKVTRGLRIYCMVDKSGSMAHAIQRAINYLTKFLGGFPLDRLHVSVFNTVGTEIEIKAPKAIAVEHAFKGHTANGGTVYGQGLAALAFRKPQPDEDVLFLFVGDQEGEQGRDFAQTVRNSGFNPVAFGFLNVGRTEHGTVTMAAQELGIPCFTLDEAMFTSDDPYVVTRVFRDLIAATPVQKTGIRAATVAPARVTLVQQILQTPLLTKPVWAEAA